MKGVMTPFYNLFTTFLGWILFKLLKIRNLVFKNHVKSCFGIIMKKIYITILFMNFLGGIINAQEMKIAGKSLSKSFENKEADKSVVLLRVQEWFNREADPENDKVIVYDTDKGEMSMTGQTEVLYKNIGKEMYPKRTGMAEVLEAKFGYKVDVQVSEDIYEITYTVTDMKDEMYKKQELFYDCINFEQIDEMSLESYNKAMEKLLKANLVFKKRRNIFTDNSRHQFEEVSNFLLGEGEVIIFSINDAITSQ